MDWDFICLDVSHLGVDSVIHLASPLPGTSDTRTTLDVRIPLPPPTPFQRHSKPLYVYLPSVITEYVQATKKGCLNTVRQAEKAGIKQIVVISSVAALALLIPGITVKAPLTSNGTYAAFTCIQPSIKKDRRVVPGL